MSQLTSAAYCTSAQLSQYGIRAEALTNIDADVISANIAAASDVIDSYLRSRFELPLLSWGADVTGACAKISVYEIMRSRGFNSARGSDERIKDAYDEAVKWLVDVSAERATPAVTDSSPGAAPGDVQGGGTAMVSSYRSRGYFVANGRDGRAFQGRR